METLMKLTKTDVWKKNDAKANTFVGYTILTDKVLYDHAVELQIELDLGGLWRGSTIALEKIIKKLKEVRN